MRFKSILTSIGLVIGVLTTPFSITTAAALEIKSAPANWGYIYASGKTASVQTAERNYSAYLEKKEQADQKTTLISNKAMVYSSHQLPLLLERVGVRRIKSICYIPLIPTSHS